MMKTCSKCKVEKSLDCFTKNEKCKYGVSSRCKDCAKEYASLWYSKNKGHQLEYGRQWRDKNRERYAERTKKNYADYYNKNKERLLKENREHKASLTDNVIRSILSHRSLLSSKEVPEELIEVKRLQIQIRNQVKEMSK